MRSESNFYNNASENRRADGMKKNRVLKQMGEFLFRQGLIDIEEKKKFDESIH